MTQHLLYVLAFTGSRDGSMGLWEVTEEVLSQTAHAQSEESMPSYAHISYRALKDIPKEYTNPYNCKVRALAFNNNHKVSFSLSCSCFLMMVVHHITLLSASLPYLQELGAVSLDGYFHLWKAENNLCKVKPENSATSFPAVPRWLKPNRCVQTQQLIPSFAVFFPPASVH